jgi:hypothetical protein
LRLIIRRGPAKTVEETSLIRIDQLQAGRGVLTLTGKGTENEAPVEVRTTLRVGRNIWRLRAKPPRPASRSSSATVIRS